jgi:hypothetical protein
MNPRIFIAALFVLFIACNTPGRESTMTISDAVQLEELQGECPHLTKDSKGAAVLSWVRTAADNTKSFCYAVTSDGKTFSTPVVIPGTGNVQPHGENIPKVIFKPSGEIIAVWGAKNPNPNNKYSGLVFYSQSFDEGKSWTAPKPLVNDTASYDQRYFDVALLATGEAGIIWLDNRKTTDKEGSGLYFASTKGKNGFGAGQLISQPTCQCCRTDLHVDKQGGIHAVFRGIVQDSIRDMLHIVSTDGGKTFSQPKRISNDNWVINGCPHTGPAMTDNASGIHFAWYTGARTKGSFYTYTNDNGNSFKPADSISARASHPQIASMPGGDLLIAWDEPYVSGDIATKRIGIQRRTADGASTPAQYLTSTDMHGSYPVVMPLNGHTSIVAYTSRKDDKSFIAWQTVSF